MLFKPADAVCLPSLLEGLSIEEPLIETIPDEVLAAVGRDLRQWEHFYTVKSDLVSGWVIGGSASGRQDQKSYSARTMFDGWVPGDEVIRFFEVNVAAASIRLSAEEVDAVTSDAT